MLGAKPQSPSRLETLLVSPLAWLLAEVGAEDMSWSAEELDVMAKGNIAHDFFEHVFFKDQPIPEPEALTAAVSEAYDRALTQPDLAPALAPAIGFDDATLALVAARATTLKVWLTDQGYTELRAEILVLGHTAEGAEIPGTIDLLAIGPAGSVLIDHKSGGGGDGFGPYWPQLSSYAGLYPQHPLQGVAAFWIDHGWLELAESETTVEQNEPV